MANKNYIWISDKHKIYIFSKVPNIQWDSTVWDILILNMFCCLFEIQMWLGILYFIWQLYFFFKAFIHLFVKSSFRFTAKLEGRYGYIPYTLYLPCPSNAHTQTRTQACAHKASLIVNIPHRWNICYHWWTYIDTSYSKSIVYFKIHTWYCTLCGFEQTYNDMHPSIWYLTECFHCPKKSSVLCLFITPALHSPLQSLILLLSH